MISENEVRQMYEKALDRVVGYHGMASQSKHMKELYEVHLYYASELGHVLDLSFDEIMAMLKERLH